MIISDHAQQKMYMLEISEEEILACLDYGDLISEQVVNGEMRYAKRLGLKDKILILVYAVRETEKRVITCYKLRRKKWQ